MSKRETVLKLLDENELPEYTPAAFFLHFDPEYHQGQAAVEKHLEYFRYTGMDFIKIQYERLFPHLAEIRRPEDWANLPKYTQEFYAPQLEAVAGLVKAAKREALVVQTLYSPFMCAAHTAGGELLTQHIQENPEAVKKGMEIITDSLMTFVQSCIALGIDGFYHSTQGGEVGRFSDRQLFDLCVKPYDRILMDEINRTCIFNILHVCDYNGPYDDLTPYLDYPGQIVNSPLEIGGRRVSPKEIARMFRRPFMGGLDRKGVLLTGSPEMIRRTAQDALRQAPQRFILGADCTVPSEVNWDNLRLAIETAHEYQPEKG